MKRLVRVLGTVLVLAGAGVLAWAITVWQWQDPFTAALNELEQRELAERFDERIAARDASLAHATRPDLAAAAVGWRRSSAVGDAVARLTIPRLGVREIVVNGTDSATLKRGPGRHLGSAMPGEGELVYIAGHRTTYGAPFSDIDKLRKGDRVSLEVPYGVFEYRVTGFRIVPATKTSELRSRGYEQLALQACHPRFFATQRYIVYAQPIRVTPRGGEPAEPVEASGQSGR